MNGWAAWVGAVPGSLRFGDFSRIGFFEFGDDQTSEDRIAGVG